MENTVDNIPDFKDILAEAKNKISLSTADAKEFVKLVKQLEVVKTKIEQNDGELPGAAAKLMVTSLNAIKDFAGKIKIG